MLETFPHTFLDSFISSCKWVLWKILNPHHSSSTESLSFLALHKALTGSDLNSTFHNDSPINSSKKGTTATVEVQVFAQSLIQTVQIPSSFNNMAFPLVWEIDNCSSLASHLQIINWLLTKQKNNLQQDTTSQKLALT